MYKVILSNGLTIECEEYVGSMFITRESVTAKDFAGGLKSVRIEGPSEEDARGDLSIGEHGAMELTCVMKLGTRTGFSLSEVVVPERTSGEALRADVDYLLMMSEEA